MPSASRAPAHDGERPTERQDSSRRYAATEIASRLAVAARGERNVAARKVGERARTTQAATR
jgi:hypothetical protein